MEPVIVPRSEHTISRKLIDPDAVKVLYRLHRAGYQAYLVGGGVRDLLVGRRPKDFDISTDAHPHQVKRLFRNCRLIGRRFRLAHVHFGEKIVEVSTFRRRSDTSEDNGEDDILIRSDNTFGNAEEDALRRDFTINGLFYDIGSFSLIDYVGGLPDLRERVVRTIGDPDIRFREDPVRMIRAIKFAARLDFVIEPATYEAILRHRDEIMKSARPRLLEEVFRLLNGGAAAASFRLLHQTGLLEILIPEVAAHVSAVGPVVGPAESGTIWRWLEELDRLKAADVTVGNPVLVGALVAELAFGNGPEGTGGFDISRLSLESEDRVRIVLGNLGVPRRDTERIFQIYRAQRRLVGQRGRRFSPRAFVIKHYFPEALQFFGICSEVTGQHAEAAAKWRSLAAAAGLPGNAPAEPRRRRRRRRRRGGFEETFDRDTDDLASEAPHDWNDEARDDRGGLDRPGKAVEEEPAATAAPAGNRVEEDEDSQIRFLGWSDQPEILRPRNGESIPIPNPYRRSGEAPRPGGWQSRRGRGPEGRGHASHRRGQPHPNRPGYQDSGRGGPRRDGRRPGRRKPRDRRD